MVKAKDLLPDLLNSSTCLSRLRLPVITAKAKSRFSS
jgi:hypothetical protein